MIIGKRDNGRSYHIELAGGGRQMRNRRQIRPCRVGHMNKKVVQLVVTYPIEAKTIKSTVQNMGVAVDQKKKYRTQNEREIYLFIFI